jgi:hypothetical protein
MSTTSILMVLDHQKIGKRILGHLRMRGRKEPSIIKEITTAKEGPRQTGGEVAAEAHSSLHIACTRKMTQTIAQNIAQSS